MREREKKPAVQRRKPLAARVGVLCVGHHTYWPQFEGLYQELQQKMAHLVAKLEGSVIGWAALTPTSRRGVYEGVAEVSVYVTETAQGKGVGRALLRAGVAESERAGIWTLQAGIFPENKVSLALHERCGFRTVGVRDRLGQMDGIWRDVVLLERRSMVVGI